MHEGKDNRREGLEQEGAFQIYCMVDGLVMIRNIDNLFIIPREKGAFLSKDIKRD